ncbi:transcription factor bHLH162 [Lolium perenne]|uniref:transcription factor bHLH162 n=1 Tax=Lolium perenne TaxID=4522 RepID=UPI0021F5FA26|nr:transcription factor bHLH162-like [Lolium perenne]
MEAKAQGGKRSRTNGGSGTMTVDRKEVERERRQHMKELCAQLVSLIPKEHCPSTDTLSLLGSLDEATTYINKLKERVDELHQRRSFAQAEARLRGGACSCVSTLMNCGTGSKLESVKAEKASVAPVVEVRYHVDSSMEVFLICSTERSIKLHEVITILEEEGAEVVNANHSVAGHKIFYTIHSRAFSSRIGIDDSRVAERLRALV